MTGGVDQEVMSTSNRAVGYVRQKRLGITAGRT